MPVSRNHSHAILLLMRKTVEFFKNDSPNCHCQKLLIVKKSRINWSNRLELFKTFSYILVHNKTSYREWWFCYEPKYKKSFYVNLVNLISLFLIFWQWVVHSIAFLVHTNTAQKMKFSIKDFITFTKEIFNGKLHFFVKCKVIHSRMTQKKSVRNAPKYFLLSSAFSHFSSINNRQCSVL